MLKLLITKQIVAALVRHVMTAAGGAMVAQGLATPELAQELTGGAIALSGIAWSFAQKRGVI